MNSFNDIARYAEGDMTPEEQAAFEASLAADENLQQQLDLYRQVHGSLQQHFTHDEQRAQLQHTLQDLRGEFFANASAPAKVVSFKRYVLRAIAVAAVGIAVIFVWQPWQQPLTQRYAATEMPAPVERGPGSDSVLQEAVTAFNQKDFTTAAQKLLQVRQQDTANSYVNFYYGVALYQTDQVQPARSVFNTLFNGESAFKYEAAFYQALLYLKEGNKRTCIEWLQKIPTDAPNYEKVKKLVGELE
jgi:tetratricopeptide (TPR) repeat protein